MKRRRWVVPAALFGFVGAITAGALVYASRTTRVAPAQSVTTSISAPVTIASIAATAPVAASASVATSASVSASAAAPTAKPAIKKPVVDCSNPYTRDELGRKIYKRECLERDGRSSRSRCSRRAPCTPRRRATNA